MKSGRKNFSNRYIIPYPDILPLDEKTEKSLDKTPTKI